VLEIIPLVENISVNLGENRYCLTPSFLSYCASCNFALRSAVTLLCRAIPTGVWNLVTVAHRCSPLLTVAQRCSTLLNVAKVSRPTSMPVALSNVGNGSGATMQLKHAYQFPFSRLLVSALISPLSSRCNLILTLPILDNCNLLPRANPACGYVKESCRCFP
jgi:hypothetical protein